MAPQYVLALNEGLLVFNILVEFFVSLLISVEAKYLLIKAISNTLTTPNFICHGTEEKDGGIQRTTCLPDTIFL